MTTSSNHTPTTDTPSDAVMRCHASGQAHLHDVHALSTADIDARLLEAEQLCQTKKVRFTPLRRNVYELILKADKPIGAYDLIQHLQNTREQQDGKDAKMVAPPTIYRTLDFLLQLGLIHQINSINAFVPCCHPRDQHNAVFLMCQQCQHVQECSGLPIQGIGDFVKNEAGFHIEQSVMELSGLCQNCLTDNDNSNQKMLGDPQ